MKLTIDKKISLSLLAVILLGALAFGFYQKAHATPLGFPKGVSTSTASSSPSYFAVTATSTLVIDAYQLAGGSSLNNTKYDSATVGVQLIATTSGSSILGWRYEYAIDQPGVDCSVTQTACDWYSDNLFTRTNATSTQNINPQNQYSYSWVFSSSTDLCSSAQPIASNNRGCKLIDVPTPTRYTRVLFYKQIGATTNLAVWATLVPTRQNKN